jgi:hypothetical protein
VTIGELLASHELAELTHTVVLSLVYHQLHVLVGRVLLERLEGQSRVAPASNGEDQVLVRWEPLEYEVHMEHASCDLREQAAAPSIGRCWAPEDERDLLARL